MIKLTSEWMSIFWRSDTNFSIYFQDNKYRNKHKTNIQIFLAGVAQLVEQLTCNQLVGGSSPFLGSMWVVTRVAKWGRL